MSLYERRRFLTISAGAAVALALAGRGTSAFAQDRHIRHAWWGSPERDRRTFAAIDIFNSKTPGIMVEGETMGFADYFAKLAAQIAAEEMPDVIQMGYGVMFEYIKNGAIVPLDDHIGTSLDVSRIDQSALDAGTVDGKLYGVSIGANSHVAMYNSRHWDAIWGVNIGNGRLNPFHWTYDDLARVGKEVTDKTGIPATDDNTANFQNFSDFVGQMGATMYADGQFTVPKEIVEDYWQTWRKIREAGATPAPEETAALAGAPELAQLGLVTGKTAMSYAWSNQLVGAQALMADPIGAAMFPNTPAMVPGSIIQPSQFVCLTRDSKDREAATTYMSAFVNDLEMTTVLGLERGIPSQPEVRAALAPHLTDIERVSVEFFEGIQGKTMLLPPPPPSGANDVEQAFKRLAAEVLTGARSPAEVAADFLQQAKDILARA